MRGMARIIVLSLLSFAAAVLITGCGGDGNSEEKVITAEQLAKLLSFDAQDYDGFGNSVSISGDYIIVGAYQEDEVGGNAGAAYIFHRIDTNTWDTGTKIVASDAQADDSFGQSVSISGDYAIVGAHAEDGGGSDAGAAYIFHRIDTNTWDSGTKIVASDAEAVDYFGYSVSISGAYAIVGAFLENGGAGSAYIFHRTDTTWDTGTKIVASDAQAGDFFGQSVSISGDYAIVGAFLENGGAGSAYIFHRTNTNTWDTGTKIVASDAQAGDDFGCSVSISGDYAIVGAYTEDGGDGDPMPDAGAAYIFRRTNTNTWDSGTKIVASDAQAGDSFGQSVSISGDYAIVGARNEDGDPGNPITNAGAAYIFYRTDTNTWNSGTKIVASDAQAVDSFGCSVTISDDYIIAGAYQEDGGDGDLMPDAGAAYLYQYD
jgi:hypothetical protein